MKKIICIFLFILMILIGYKVYYQSEVRDIKAKDKLEQVFKEPDKYKGYKVDFNAQIFMPVFKNDKETIIQVFADPENLSINALIVIKNPDLNVKLNDLIHVEGLMKGRIEGKNNLGNKVTVPLITANKIEKIK